MKISIVLLFLMSVLNLKGQEVTNRINEIRKMYQTIIEGKENYSTQVKDITWETFEHNQEEDRSLKKTVTYYCDGKQIKMAIISTSIISDYSLYKQEAECYYENGSVFFVYLSENKRERTSLDPENSNEAVNVIEKRIYLDKSEKCIYCLQKEIEGSSDTIESLRQKSKNIEQECTEIADVIYEILSLLKDTPQK